jgi:3-oxoacyl-(acyl-carrier-protein) synthase
LRRVVISGVGAVSGLGHGVAPLVDGIAEGRSAVHRMEGWEAYKGLRSLVGAPAKLENEKDIPRKARRSMGRMGIFAVQASEQAPADARIDRDELGSARVGCIIG